MSIFNKKSKFPVAVDTSQVGSYPALTKSGAGHFYDDVLEYRVWIHPVNEDVCFWAFASYEEARDFRDKVRNKEIQVNINGTMQYINEPQRVEDPLALVSQIEWIDEPEDGKYIHMHPKDPRITEWQVQWLEGKSGTKKQIPIFIAKNKKQ